jgi:cytochrome c oxidase subunit 2
MSSGGSEIGQSAARGEAGRGMARAVRARVATPLLLCLVVAGCGGTQSTLDPKSRASDEIATLWWWMLLIACVVFAGALGLLGVAWVRRRRPGLPLVKDSGGRNMALVVLFGILIPITVNVALFIVANFFVIKQTEAPAVASTTMTVEVVGRQWFWEVRYPGTPQAVTANEIHIPARTRVNLVATTGDVIHSFWVPQLNRKIDMIPGRRNRILLSSDKPGRYRGQCAEFCGIEHARMSMYVYVQQPAAFQRWLRGIAAPARPPSGALAKAGAAAFTRNQCASCHTIRGTSARGQVGPDLTHIGSRVSIGALTLPNTAAALHDWLSDPQHAKPGNRMPDLGLSPADLRSLVAYLQGLR